MHACGLVLASIDGWMDGCLPAGWTDAAAIPLGCSVCLFVCLRDWLLGYLVAKRLANPAGVTSIIIYGSACLGPIVRLYPLINSC